VHQPELKCNGNDARYKNEQAVPSFDAEGLQSLESIHDQLEPLKSPVQSISAPRIMLVISKPSRREERKADGGKDFEGHWVQEEVKA
jgi:hypothetical protein